MLIPSVILDSLVQSLQAAVPGGTTVLKAGDSSGSSLSLAWVECWIDRVTSPPARRTVSPTHADLSFTVNCLGRPPATPTQVQTLAEAIRQHLTSLRLSLQSESTGEGLIRLQEPEMRDLSRPATHKSAELLQWTITVRGTLFPCSTLHS